MDRAYKRSQVYTPRRANTRRISEIEKPLFSLKKLIAQTIASVLVFSFIYSANFFENDFFKAVKKEAAYTVNYTVDLQSIYLSSQQILKYLSGSIEQGKIYINNAISPEQENQDIVVDDTAKNDAAMQQTVPESVE